VLLSLVLVATGCRSAAFSFATTQPPRVSVIHHPLNPRPDQEIVIEARAEAAPGRRVAELRIEFFGPVGPAPDGEPRDEGHLTVICRDAPTCTLRVPPRRAVGQALYGASMKDDRGRGTSARSGYSFQVGRRGDILALRVPVNLRVDDSVFKILLLRDRETYLGAIPEVADAAALADVETLLYSGLLEDPALRWRDHQLAFYWSTYPGVTRGYHSGLRSRCGQAPWLGSSLEGRATTAAEDLMPQAVGVIHLRPGERDCAGLQEGSGPQGFSAHGQNPAGFTHELGHSLFGLGDEYWESTADRTTRLEALPPPDPSACSCCTPDISGFCPPGQRECTGFDEFPPECFPAPAEVCPPLRSLCARPNVFPSQEPCQAEAAAIVALPGLAGSTTPADCRLLCSPAGPPCPCPGPGWSPEVWILDRRTPGDSVSPDDDLMGNLDGASPSELLGPACHHCIETAFCISWEEGRGRSPAQIQALCGAAP